MESKNITFYLLELPIDIGGLLNGIHTVFFLDKKQILAHLNFYRYRQKSMSDNHLEW